MKIRKKSKDSAVEEVAIESGENAIANKEVEGLTQSQIIRRRFFKHKAAVASRILRNLKIILFLYAVDYTILPIKNQRWWYWNP
ncbi:MAG: ABC transporter permease, partial [bacterium]